MSIDEKMKRLKNLASAANNDEGAGIKNTRSEFNLLTICKPQSR